jgi:hypothetical protein
MGPRKCSDVAAKPAPETETVMSANSPVLLWGVSFAWATGFEKASTSALRRVGGTPDFSSSWLRAHWMEEPL